MTCVRAAVNMNRWKAAIHTRIMLRLARTECTCVSRSRCVGADLFLAFADAAYIQNTHLNMHRNPFIIAWACAVCIKHAIFDHDEVEECSLSHAIGTWISRNQTKIISQMIAPIQLFINGISAVYDWYWYDCRDVECRHCGYNTNQRSRKSVN